MAENVCPVWVAYLLASPLRKLIQNPHKLLKPYIDKGMTVLDAGCAMGFFSIPAAQLSGNSGKVICVDMQEKMLEKLAKRAAKKGVGDRIILHLCSQKSLKLDNYREKVDFAFAIAVVHEVPDTEAFFSEIYQSLKTGSKFLIIEPKGHVGEDAFEKTIATASECGFNLIEYPLKSAKLSAVFKK